MIDGRWMTVDGGSSVYCGQLTEETLCGPVDTGLVRLDGRWRGSVDRCGSVADGTNTAAPAAANRPRTPPPPLMLTTRGLTGIVTLPDRGGGGDGAGRRTADVVTSPRHRLRVDLLKCSSGKTPRIQQGYGFIAVEFAVVGRSDVASISVLHLNRLQANRSTLPCSSVSRGFRHLPP